MVQASRDPEDTRGRLPRVPTPNKARGGRQVHVPNSVGGLVFQQLRPRLPITWQYGWRFQMLQGTWIVCGITFCGWVGNVCLGMSDEEIRSRAAEYTFVRDETGKVIDVGYKPLVDAATRAKSRTSRMRDGDL